MLNSWVGCKKENRANCREKNVSFSGNMALFTVESSRLSDSLEILHLSLSLSYYTIM